MKEPNKPLQSLALRTDLMFVKQNGEVLEREKYWLVRTPSFPAFYWGNFLIFKNAPRAGDFKHWTNTFKTEFTDPNIQHQAFAWDDPSAAAINEFENAGFKLQNSICLTANHNQLRQPTKSNTQIEIRPIDHDPRKSQQDWKAVVEVQAASADDSVIKERWMSFYEKQATLYQKMIEKKLGLWFGAYLENQLVASLFNAIERTPGLLFI